MNSGWFLPPVSRFMRSGFAFNHATVNLTPFFHFFKLDKSLDHSLAQVSAKGTVNITAELCDKCHLFQPMLEGKCHLLCAVKSENDWVTRSKSCYDVVRQSPKVAQKTENE